MDKKTFDAMCRVVAYVKEVASDFNPIRKDTTILEAFLDAMDEQEHFTPNP